VQRRITAGKQPRIIDHLRRISSRGAGINQTDNPAMLNGDGSSQDSLDLALVVGQLDRG
jgi:hypothetical protein